MRLILVRHGKPDEVGTVGSAQASNPGLDARGVLHAQAVAHALSNESLTHIVSSPLLRAMETAEPLVQTTGIALTVMEGFAEADKNSARYRSLESLKAQGETEWQRFLSDPIRYLGSDPETFRTSVLGALHHCLQLPQNSRVAIFTHGMVINTVLSHILGLQSLTHFSPGYGSLTRLGVRQGGKLGIISVNELGHQSSQSSSLPSP